MPNYMDKSDGKKTKKQMLQSYKGKGMGGSTTLPKKKARKAKKAIQGYKTPEAGSGSYQG